MHLKTLQKGPPQGCGAFAECARHLRAPLRGAGGPAGARRAARGSAGAPAASGTEEALGALPLLGDVTKPAVPLF
jgi:hypothetical protein